GGDDPDVRRLEQDVPDVRGREEVLRLEREEQPDQSERKERPECAQRAGRAREARAQELDPGAPPRRLTGRFGGLRRRLGHREEARRGGTGVVPPRRRVPATSSGSCPTSPPWAAA